VRAAFDDLSMFEDEDLVRAPDGREAVRDDEGRPAEPQRTQAVLDDRLAFAVEARRRFVEHEDAGIGQDRARDRDALPLPS
jgi:hypothetical protein